ncbi:hypothetical protein [Pedobacter chitinilyticus]|uniref:DUF4145 domain-containing protein n=1 Tax=Pedobacter chitinilyticus TaxID=2233776 RepID=A0A3S3QGX8_9SPHI|nr:hypothetical protein [Pedobacter chitinilyticus]RWU09880.1 hypothetical protein DPV69_00600 [Pedobacter chitinilyticus]
MEKYLIPDERWKIFGCKTFEEFENLYILNNPFVSSVPKDILLAYETVRHLMAFSYYHYEMYDEAYKKIVWMFEMAIELKLKQIISENAVETKMPKNLIDKISYLANNSSIKGFEKQLHNIRQIRNYYAHPKKNGFIGSLGRPPMIGILNMINYLFIDDKRTVLWNSYSKEQSAKFAKFSNIPLVIQYKNGRVLIDGIGMGACLNIDNDLYSVCWGMSIEAKTAIRRSEHVIEPLIFLTLRNIEFIENRIKAIIVGTEEIIDICSPNSLELKLYTHVMQSIFEEDAAIKMNFENIYSSQISNQIEEFIFNFSKVAYR